jgi:nucleotide-binding universal stress UspA family protein
VKILLAVDGSSYTKKMLAYISTHAELFGQAGNDFHAFTVEPAVPPRARSALGSEVVNQYYAEDSEKTLAPVCKFLARHGIDAKSSYKVGHAGEEIAAMANKGKFDMVVMGSHGHGALASLMMGSVASRVLANCEVPVLLVR